jgi:hypothetical protein
MAEKEREAQKLVATLDPLVIAMNGMLDSGQC